MELTPQDFSNYAQATGAPYPRNAAEKAAMAPAVMQWKGAQRQEQPEGRSALATAGLVGLIGAGVAGAGYGAHRLLQRPSAPSAPGAPPSGAKPTAPGAEGVPGSGAGPGGPATSPVEVDPVHPEAYRAARARDGRLRPGPATLQVASRSGVIAAADERGLYTPGKNPLEHPVLGPKIAAALSETDPATQAAMLARLESEVRVSGSADLQANWKQLVRQVAQGASSRQARTYGGEDDRTLAKIQAAWESSGKDWQSGVDLDDPGRGDPGREPTDPGAEIKETGFRVKSKAGATRTKRFTLGALGLSDDVYAAQGENERSWDPIVGDKVESLGHFIDAIEGDTGAEGQSIPVPFSRTTPRGQGEVGYRGKIQSELAKSGKASDENYNYRNTSGRTPTDKATRKLLQEAGYNLDSYSRTGKRPMQQSERLLDDPPSNGLTGQWINGQWMESGESLGGFARQVQESYDYRVQRLGHAPSARTMRKATAFVEKKAEAEAGDALRTVLASATHAWQDGVTEADLVATAGTVARAYGMDENNAVKIIRIARELDSAKKPVRKTSAEGVDVMSYPVRIHNENTDILPGQQREAVTNRALAAARQVREIVKAQPGYRTDMRRQEEQIAAQAAAFGVQPEEVKAAEAGMKAAENYQRPTERLANPSPAGYGTRPDSRYAPFEHQWTGQVLEAITKAPILGPGEVKSAALSLNREGVRDLAYSALQNVPQFLGITRNQEGKYEVNAQLAAEKGLAPIGHLDAGDQMSIVGEALTAAANDYAEALHLARNSDDPLLREAGERAFAGGLKGSHEFEQFATPYVKEYVQLRALLSANNDPDRPARLRIPQGSSEILALRALTEGRSFDEVLNEGLRGSETLADGVLDLMAPTAHINAGLPADFGGQIGEEARTYGDLLQINHRRKGSAGSAMGMLKQQLSEAQMSADPSRKGVPVRGIQIMLTPGFKESGQINNRQGIEHEIAANALYAPMERGFGDPGVPLGPFSRNVVKKQRLDTSGMGATLDTIIGELDRRNYRLKNPVEGRQPPENLAAELENSQRLLDQHRNMLNLLETHPAAVQLAISDYNTGGRPNSAGIAGALGTNDLPMIGYDARSGRPIVQRVDRRSGMQSIDQGEQGYDTWMGNQAEIAEGRRETGLRPTEEQAEVADARNQAPGALPGFDPLNDEHMRQLDVAIERHKGAGGDTALLRDLEKRKEQSMIDRQNPDYRPLVGPAAESVPERESLTGQPEYVTRRLNRHEKQQPEARAFRFDPAQQALLEAVEKRWPSKEEVKPVKDFNYDAAGRPRTPAQNAYVQGDSAPMPRPVPTTNEIPRSAAGEPGSAATAVREQIEARAQRQGQAMPPGAPVAAAPRSVPLGQEAGEPVNPARALIEQWQKRIRAGVDQELARRWRSR